MQKNFNERFATQIYINYVNFLLNKRIHFKTLNAFNRKNQRMRNKMHILQIYVFNYDCNQQQLSLFINQLQQNFYEIKQIQFKQKKLSITLIYKQDQTIIKMTFMIQIIENMNVNLRRKQDKIIKLSLLITKLNYIKLKNLRCVLNTEIDIVDMLKKYMIEKQKSDKEKENEKH